MMQFKRVSAVLLALIMLVISCACNNDNEKADGTEQTTDEVKETMDTTETKTTEGTETTTAIADDPVPADSFTAPDPKLEQQDVVYKKVDDISLLMTIYKPTKKVYDKSPVLYLVTGGGWNTCDRAGMVGMVQGTVNSLRAEGFTVTTIDYRLLGKGAKQMKQIISDCMDGVRYLVYFKDVLSIDTDKIIVLGHSAGGHLALCTSICDQSKFVSESAFAEGYDYKVLGCCALSPLTVCYEVDGEVLTACKHITQLFQSSLLNRKQDESDASPLDQVRKDMPKVLIAAGDKDDAVDPKNTYMFRDKAAEVGADVITIISENAGHCFESIGGAAVSYSLNQVQKECLKMIRDLIK